MTAKIIEWREHALRGRSSKGAAQEKAAATDGQNSLATYKHAIHHLLGEAEGLEMLLLNLERLSVDDEATRLLRTTREALIAMIVRARQAIEEIDQTILL